MSLAPLAPTVEDRFRPNPPSATSEAGKWVSEADYWAHYYEHPYFNYEWNDGILEEVPMADKAQFSLYQWFLLLLTNYLNTHPIADMIGLETAFKLTRWGGRTSIRKPDLGIVLHTNPQPWQMPDKSYKGIPDICVESLSDSTQSEIDRDTIQKKGEYAQAGVTEYYILDPENEHTAFYRLTKRGTYAPIRPNLGGIIHSNVLPGFRFRLTDLNDLPWQGVMANDALYHEFVLPEYQFERARAERAEATVAEQAREIERLKALLKK